MLKLIDYVAGIGTFFLLGSFIIGMFGVLPLSSRILFDICVVTTITCLVIRFYKSKHINNSGE